MKRLCLIILGSIILNACGRQATKSLENDWNLISYGPVSNSVRAVENVDAFVRFTSDGKFSGDVGCNIFNGNYKIEGEKIIFTSISSTKMACKDVIGEQEKAVLHVFSGTSVFLLDGNTLSITSEDGDTIIVLMQK
jgi:heat shock protein HslJ